LDGHYPEIDHSEQRKKHSPREELLDQRDVVAEAFLRKMMEDKGAVMAPERLEIFLVRAWSLASINGSHGG
jgi:hypothetical protein